MKNKWVNFTSLSFCCCFAAVVHFSSTFREWALEIYIFLDWVWRRFIMQRSFLQLIFHYFPRHNGKKSLWYRWELTLNWLKSNIICSQSLERETATPNDESFNFIFDNKMRLGLSELSYVSLGLRIVRLDRVVGWLTSPRVCVWKNLIFSWAVPVTHIAHS